jgi:DNA-binding MarR family transcriptional regulator
VNILRPSLQQAARSLASGQAVAEPHDDCFAIRQAMRAVSKRFDVHLLPVGLKTTQFSLLRRLKSLGPMTGATLADLLFVDRTTLARAIEPLLRDRLISKKASGPGRRGAIVALTEAGRSRLLTAEDLWKEAQFKLEAQFGTVRAAILRRELMCLKAG